MNYNFNMLLTLPPYKVVVKQEMSLNKYGLFLCDKKTKRTSVHSVQHVEIKSTHVPHFEVKSLSELIHQ